MEHICKGSTCRDFVTILIERSMKDFTAVRLQSTKKYRLPSPPSVKCNVLRESLCEESQNIPCATLKRRGSWFISIHFWLCPWLKACNLEACALCAWLYNAWGVKACDFSRGRGRELQLCSRKRDTWTVKRGLNMRFCLFSFQLTRRIGF